ncbi:thioredoxin-disulfide reductase [Lachnotalea sp. AF33-28]|uniref:thioredoxin-disulfide reductase n=1 Tax=Lachnotalea sp. AF33-28 TaxID=2292046 RepID=UPI000E4FAF7D|nr:thioredoxin-disulfide reductase [Lachnotalea sp. AF33-28]RHP29729.1 thioredoxin-disulfide reductase [Lachnotalea sp. AF33-28]
MSEVYDLVIIGSGPAGLAAAIYAERAKLKAVTIEKNVMSGGQVVNTYEVDNYPGLPGMNGFDLAMKFREHAQQLGAGFQEDTVQTILSKDGLHQVVCENGTYEGKTVLIATGATHRKLGAPGEEQFSGMGVSYCATCDGAFFRNKVTAVIGGGDVAVEDAIFLARLCKKVYLIHRRDELRAAKSLQEKLFAMENVEVLWDSVVEEIKGENNVNSISVKNVKTKEQKDVSVDGVFVAVGILPNSDEFKGVVELDPQGYIKAGEEGITSVPGIFAAGDVRTKALRQIVTAVSDGANAITSIEKYLNH